MSKNKRKSAPVPQMSKQEKRRVEQEQQKKKTTVLIISTIAIIVIIFAGLFMLASRDNDSKTTAEFNYSELPRLGSENAPVKIVEFGDFKCPACASFSTGIKPQIVQQYIEQDKAALYFVNMAFIGPDSTTASLAALSIYHQNNDAFWKFYDAIYANQGDENKEWATTDYLVSLAQNEKLDIDYDLLRKDIEERTYLSELQRDIQLAGDSGVSSTPTLFVNGVMVDEPFNMEAIDAEVQAAAEAAAAQ